jgi:uncharacterized membrane protein
LGSNENDCNAARISSKYRPESQVIFDFFEIFNSKHFATCYFCQTLIITLEKMKHFYNFIFWPTFFISQLITLALISWHLMAQVHFAYPVGYKLLDLQSHIAEFAPINRYKDDFEFTSPQEHWRLFGEISDSIQNHGKGLADIRYTLSNGQTTLLMHQDEIIHLQDVANLVDKFYFTGYIALAIWLLAWIIIFWQKPRPPSNKKVLTTFLSLLAITGTIILLLGAKDVFYWLHIQIFPADHKWFFYYQDSLMTTLMKAPDIFAFISILLVIALIVLWIISSYCLTKLVRSRK